MVQCNVCGGRYEPVQADGCLYFHACPPLAVHELKAHLAGGTVVLSKAQQAQLDAATARDLQAPPKPGDPTQADAVLGSFTILRPGHRDENLVVDPRLDVASQKAPGAGVTDLGPVEA